MAATILDGNALLETVKDDLRARIKRLGERASRPASARSSSATIRRVTRTSA